MERRGNLQGKCSSERETGRFILKKEEGIFLYSRKKRMRKCVFVRQCEC